MGTQNFSNAEESNVTLSGEVSKDAKKIFYFYHEIFFACGHTQVIPGGKGVYTNRRSVHRIFTSICNLRLYKNNDWLV